MTGTFLVLNVGSSSVRYRLGAALDDGQDVHGHLEDIGGEGPADHDSALREAFRDLAERWPSLRHRAPTAVGHRFVHGGNRFHAPVAVDESVMADLRALAPLAPLHTQVGLAGITAARDAFPGTPQVAVFDTAFHADLPPRAFTYAVPTAWRDEHAVRRYGFHGSSFAHVARRAALLLGLAGTEANLILLHLGNGASACAVRGGRSIDTSMGLSPLEGLVMGSRSGDVDPSLGAFMARVAGLGPAAYEDALNHDSGLAALAGTTDFREVVRRRATGDAHAALAFDVMAYRIRKYIGAYAVALGRVDAIVFTGGIGEHSPELRAEVLGGLEPLGVELDADANERASEPERRLTVVDSRLAAFVIPADEELEIARACADLLATSAL
ncbi:acetate/propionate family kinase [Pedococcus sp. 5OH_020]|uniref:acetate/propionate family kinase n=1 Tax=Pedococcus sp. 5OH_020 TaxID=2989814 RepID=UPI0022E9AE92|nr:acetate/propionate family kinase [Pedococcus sp. 5OH_020]